MSEKPTVTDMMVAYAQDAVDMARANFSEDLDYSERSVQKVERCLAQLHAATKKSLLGKLLNRGPSQEDIETVSKMFGGYIGEVFRRHHGGDWLVDQPPGSSGPVIALQHPSGGKFFPPATVYGRLINGAEDNVWIFYQVLTREYIKKPSA